MTPYSKRGRGILRGRDISWPFASITVEPRLITINVFGIETFTPEEVNAVQPLGGRIFGRGIRIHYTKGKAARTVASFYTLSSPTPLIEAIAAAGFVIGTPKDWL
jgi:hypothetical protein